MGMGREMPAAVAVSVGYPFDHPLPVNMARTTQLTPTAWPKWDAAVGALFGGEAAPSGGADGFVSFLSDELMPMIESEVGVNSSEWTLAGHSLGGLFTTHALLSRPGRWRRHLAISPSYWWHKHVLLDRVREFAAVPALLPVSVYLAAGDQETTEKTTQAWHPWMRSDSWRQYLEVMGGVPDLVKDARLVADLLAQRWGVRVRCDVLNEETHQSSPFAAMSRGLRWLHEV
jgi:pimeloyl-ACP methyl ester carboxylesterase